MKLFGKMAMAGSALMLAVSPALAAASAAPRSGSALSRASIQAIGGDVRVGKRVRGNNALVGLPLILVVVAGVAATAVVVNEVAGDDSPNSP